jgi:hypothetical protein
MLSVKRISIGILDEVQSIEVTVLQVESEMESEFDRFCPRIACRWPQFSVHLIPVATMIFKAGTEFGIRNHER